MKRLTFFGRFTAVSLVACFSFFMSIAQVSSGNKAILNENLSDTSYKKNIKSDAGISSVSYNEIRKTPESILFKENNKHKASEGPALLQKLLPVKPGVDALTKASELQPNKTVTVTRYQQYFKGIKVEQGSYTVTSSNGIISYISGEYYVLSNIKSVVPSVAEALALQNALTNIGAKKYMWQQEDSTKFSFAKYPKGQLVIMQDYYGTEGLVLAYKFDIYAASPLSRHEVYVSAVTGKVIYKNPLIHHANATGTADTKYSGTKTITTDSHSGSFRLRETRGAASGVETYNMKTGTSYAAAVDFTDANNTWTTAEYNNTAQDIAALDAHWGAETVYDYWKNIHNRKSWDGNDAVIKSYVHYDVAYDNAFFDGDEMNYGDGSYPAAGGFKILTTLDICGHEIGHGVCQSTSNLTYARESGGMNEGFSDIWASCIEHFADPTQSVYNYWLVGEQATPSYVKGVNRDALRDMAYPKLQGQPDTYLGQFWVDATTAGCPTPNSDDNDDCGVHTNSGVLNHWFYLLTQGGSGTNDLTNSYQLNGVGFAESEQIAFLTETTLSANATYASCRTASIAAATTLYGSCSSEVEAVTNAWYAVGVGAAYVPCVPTVQFTKTTDNITETVTPHNVCPATKIVVFGITLSSAASATTDVNLTLSGNAVAGRDYTLSSSSISFNTGEVGPKNDTITIYDDAVVDATRTLTIGYTVNAHGGNAVAGNSFNTYVLTVKDDDVAPYATYTDTITYGNKTTDLATSGAFNGTYRDKKIQHVYTAADLKSYGILPGTITAIAVNADYIASPTNTYKSFNFAAGFTTQTSITGSFISGVTNQYSNATYSLAAGWNTYPLSTPLIWDGVSNLVLQFCYDNTSNGTDDDAIEGEDAGAGSNVTAYSRVTTSGSHGCSLTAITNSQYRPILDITEIVPESVVEDTLISKSESLGPNQDVYFYSANGKIMAQVNNLTSFDYGCTQVQIDRKGSVASQFWNTNTNNYLASKSFKIIPTNTTNSGHYQVTLYYTGAEVTGWQTATGQPWSNAEVVKVTNGHYIPDVTPSTSFSTDVTVTTGAAKAALGTNYIIMGDFNNAGFSGFGAGVPGIPAVVLPVTLSNFNGYNKNNYGVLQWNTSAEYNNKGFELQKSFDGINFTDIAFVNGAGTSSLKHSYEFDDKTKLAEVQYYRLKQIGLNGATVYSKIIILKSTAAALDILNVTNPFSNRINILFSKIPTGVVKIDLLDITGKAIYSTQKTASANSVAIDIMDKLTSGSYLLKVSTGTDHFVRKLVKE